MSLVLEHRWEHALIAATIDAVSKSSPNGRLGRTAIQKLLYFMKVSGVPMKYSFDIHHFGPFCQSVMNDVEWLIADEVIKDASDSDMETSCSSFRPGPGWPDLRKQYEDDIAKYEAKITSAFLALGDLSPETLELIATLDFSFRWVRARGGNGPWRKQAVERFKQIKGDRFHDDVIDNGYTSLVHAGLIEE